MKVSVSDVDDNSPVFSQPAPGSNLTVGVRVNAPVYTAVGTVRASDPDRGGRDPVHYEVRNLTYHRER